MRKQRESLRSYSTKDILHGCSVIASPIFDFELSSKVNRAVNQLYFECKVDPIDLCHVWIVNFKRDAPIYFLLIKT